MRRLRTPIPHANGVGIGIGMSGGGGGATHGAFRAAAAISPLASGVGVAPVL